MTVYLLVGLVWKTTVLSGLALLILLLLKRRSAEERSWIAHVGLAATFLIPVAIWSGPEWAVTIPAPIDHFVARELADFSIGQPTEAASSPAGASATEMSSKEAGGTRPDTGSIVVALYFVPAVLLLLIVTLAVSKLFVLRSNAAVLTEQSWLSALANAQMRMGYKHGTALLVSDGIGSPVSWGLFRPVILLNEHTVSSSKHAEAIIAHELAHVARFDWVKLVLCRVATAVLWFNPFVWMLAKQCHQLREEAADDAVLRHEVPDHEYVELLIHAARHESGRLKFAANGVAPGPKSLRMRVARVLDTESCRQPVAKVWSAPALAAAAALSAFVAAINPVPSAALANNAIVAPPKPLEGAAPQALVPASSVHPSLEGKVSTCETDCASPVQQDAVAQRQGTVAVRVEEAEESDDDDDEDSDEDFARALKLAKAIGLDLSELAAETADEPTVTVTSDGIVIRCGDPSAAASSTSGAAANQKLPETTSGC